jgi:hypothetical protein
MKNYVIGIQLYERAASHLAKSNCLHLKIIFYLTNKKKQKIMKQIQFRLSLVILATIMSLTTFILSAQILIGSSNAPTTGAFFDLNSTGKNTILFPHVSIDNLYLFSVHRRYRSRFSGRQSQLGGSIVYNTNSATGVGLYLWDGECCVKISTAERPASPFEPGILP